MDIAFWVNVASGVGTLALASVGLAVMFGIMRVVNFAHSEFVTIGAFGMWFSSAWGLPSVLGVVVSTLAGGALAIVMYLSILRWIAGGDPIVSLLATWAFGIAVRAGIVWWLGPGFRYVPPIVEGQVVVLGSRVPIYSLVVLAVSLLACLVIWYTYQKTKIGKQSLAVAEDPDMAASVGIDVQRVHRTAVLLGGMTAGLAGALMAPLLSVGPLLGLAQLVRIFLVVLVGGLGSIFGVFGGAGVMGVSEGVLSFQINPVVAQALVFAIVAAVLVARPRGLFRSGREERWLRP